MTKKRPSQSHTIGSGPIEACYSETMKFLAGVIDEFLNGDENGKITDEKHVGFILMCFPFGHKGRCNYISNAVRDDVKTLLREQLAYFEGQSDEIKGTG